MDILIPERAYQDKLVAVLDKITDKIKYMAEIKKKRKNHKVSILTEKNRKLSQKRTSIFNREYGQYRKTGEYKPI